MITSENGRSAESLFEKLCLKVGFSSEKIPVSYFKTADYKITAHKGVFIAEIKQLNTPNYKIGEVYSYKPGNKVRHAIGRATEQLREYEYPTLLVLLDMRGLGHTDQHNIVAAMFGDLTVTINKETGKGTRIYQGKNAKIRPDINTTISAIGVMRYQLQNDCPTIYMTVYYNPYANRPFAPDFFNDYKFIETKIFQIKEVAVS